MIATSSLYAAEKDSGTVSKRRIATNTYKNVRKGVMDLFQSQKVYYGNGLLKDVTRDELRKTCNTMIKQYAAVMQEERRARHGVRGLAAIGEVLTTGEVDAIADWGLKVEEDGTVSGIEDVRFLRCSSCPNFGEYMMSMTRCYNAFTYMYTARGDDAENVTLSDCFLLSTRAAASLPNAAETKAMCFTTFESKTNNEDRLEMGAALRQKESINKCVMFAMANYLRWRFVVMKLFFVESFIPEVRFGAPPTKKGIPHLHGLPQPRSHLTLMGSPLRPL
jgi:hypothetical protein